MTATTYVPPWLCLWCAVPLSRPNPLCSRHATDQRVKR
jgi:hypothetical protein